MNSAINDMAKSARTIQFYEGYARDYSELVGTAISPSAAATLRRMVKLAGMGAQILEVGSGPGTDADFLEEHGAVVRRTDATQAFITMQAARGKSVDLVNIISDDLGGPYDGILAMCVLLHIDREHTDKVLHKIKNALRPGGVFLVSLLEGQGETDGEFHTVYWKHDAFIARLAAVDLQVRWHDRSTDGDGDTWLTYLAERQS